VLQGFLEWLHIGVMIKPKFLSSEYRYELELSVRDGLSPLAFMAGAPMRFYFWLKE